MLAAVLHAPNALSVQEVETPTPGPGEVLLRVEAVTLCGSDVRIYLGQKTGGVNWPAIIGHEFAGSVAAVGDGVALQEDSRVSVVPWMPCRRCAECRRGRLNLCANLTVMGYGISGALAEYTLIPAEAVQAGLLVPAAPDANAAELAMAEPLACAVHGHRRSDIRLGESVLVLGGGPIGLFHVQLARLAGASTIIMSEPSAVRRNFAAQVGATHLVDPTADDLRNVVFEATHGNGADHSIVCIGYGDLVNEAIACTRKGGGRLNLFAGFGGDGKAGIDLNAIHYGELDVIGNVGGTVADYRLALDLIASGKVAAAAMITDRFGLPDTDQAFQRAMSGEALKVAVIPNGAS
ncbi:MAG: alcohol dehydrogenase catalytic domain-containing protein [Vicinamibacterales bacterium]